MAASGSTSPRPISRSIDERLGFLQDLIGRRSVVTSDQQRIVSPSGREQTWLLDLRPVLLNGRALADIATLFWERFADRLPFQVCGLESACIPLLSAIALEAERHGEAVNAVVIRKERKTNGLARDIEGTLDDTPVIVVDDLTNSSASLEKVRVVLADQGKRIAEAFVVVDYRASRSLAWRKRHAIEVHSLFGGESFGRPTKSSPQIRPAHRFEPLWSSAAPGANPFIVAPRSSPASDGRMLYAGTDGGALRAIDAETGAETRSFQAEGTHRKGIWSSPALADGKIVFGAYNGIVYGLDAATGREIWRSDSADWVGSSPAIARRHKLVLIGLEHAAPSAKGSIAALDLATGAMAWEFSVPHYIHGTPALSDDEARVFVGTNEGELLCLDTATGSLVWRYAAAEAIKAAPAVSASHGVVVAGSFDQCVHLVDSATGRSRAIVKTGGKIYSTALIIGDAAYIGSQDKKPHLIHPLRRTLTHDLPPGLPL